MNKTKKYMGMAVLSAMAIMVTACGQASGDTQSLAQNKVTPQATVQETLSPGQKASLKADPVSVCEQMEPVLQSLNIMMDEGVAYDANAGGSYWTGIFITASQCAPKYWADQCKRVGDYYQVKPDVIQKIAGILYNENKDVSKVAIPDDVKDFIHYNKQKKVYLVALGEAGLQSTYITDARMNADGSITAATDFGNYENPEVETRSYNFTLVPNKDTTEDVFSYTIKEAAKASNENNTGAVDITKKMPYKTDLNQDGKKETVQLEKKKDDAGNVTYGLCVKSEDGSSTKADTITIYNDNVWLADMDQDGNTEIFLSGDVASDDYMTYCWKYDGNLKAVKFTGEVRENDVADSNVMGQIQGFDTDGSLILQTAVNTLGTYSAFRQYTCGDNGMIQPKENTNWLVNNNTTWLQLKKKMVATMEDGNARPFFAGTKLKVFATDGDTKVWFQLKNGKCGYVSITEKDDKTGWLINGKDENAIFKMLPYAG